jgi:hypothetical protein
MALGYCPALLLHMKYVVGENAPEHKITPSGFLKMMLEKGAQAKPIGDPFNLANVNGHIKDLRLKYYTRTTPAQMQTSDSCDIDLVQAYDEITIDTTSVVKFGLHFNDETIARYCDEASRSVAMGKAPSSFMEEHLAGLMAALPGFVAKIDQTLLAGITWGTNVVTGASTATAVNFNDDSTVNLFSEGWTKVMSDYRANEGQGRPQVVGSGLVDSAFIQSRNPAMTQYSPLNNNAAAGNMDYYYDLNAATSWGSNQFGVFMPGTFGLVQLDEYVGFRAAVNQPKGTSYFFNMPVPVEMPGSDGLLRMLNIDFQFKYLDCPTTTTVGYEEVTLERGWSLIMKKNFAPWQIPSDAYQASDRLTGNNGSLRYTATNS